MLIYNTVLHISHHYPVVPLVLEKIATAINNSSYIAILNDELDNCTNYTVGSIIVGSARARCGRVEIAVRLREKDLTTICTPLDVLNEIYKITCCGVDFKFDYTQDTPHEIEITGVEEDTLEDLYAVLQKCY